MSSTTANNASFVQDAASQRKTPMKVLCLGLPRAGTESLRRALQMLGIKGVYHGYDLYERPEGTLHTFHPRFVLIWPRGHLTPLFPQLSRLSKMD